MRSFLSFAADLVEETERKAIALKSTCEDFLQCRKKTVDTLKKVLKKTDDIDKLANFARVVTSIAATGGAIGLASAGIAAGLQA